LEQEARMLMLTWYIWKKLYHNLYVIFNIYDNVVSLYNFSLYVIIRVYGHFGPSFGQFLVRHCFYALSFEQMLWGRQQALPHLINKSIAMFNALSLEPPQKNSRTKKAHTQHTKQGKHASQRRH
jgi:hypothetical protein